MGDDRESLRAWLDLLAASNALKKRVDTMLRAEFGMSISRFDVLAALDRAGAEGLRAGALSQRLMVTEGATTQVTAPLAREGLIRRAASPEDGRVAIFRLTKKGERVFARMAESHRAFVAQAFAGLPPAQIRTLRRLLSRLDIDSGSAQRKDAA